jgi:predicted MPP superfamily phosphohydrolase
MTLFLAVVLSVFLLVAFFQLALLYHILPQRFSKKTTIGIALFIVLSLNTIPFFYLFADKILDQFPWWHRTLVIFPYAVYWVTSAVCGAFFLLLWALTSVFLRRRPSFKKDRRVFLSNTARVTVGAAMGVASYGAYYENESVDISRIALPYSNLHPDLVGLKIVQLTDFHAGPFMSFDKIARIVSAANDLQPDLVVLTGDYVNSNPAYIEGCISLLADLRAPAGVFGVYGNHDYYTGIEAMRTAFSKTHITMLEDGCSQAKGLEGRLTLLGADDPIRGWASDARFEDMKGFHDVAGSEAFNLLLSHRPGIFSVSGPRGIPLTLAGHTHGGQAILPGVGKRGLSLAEPFLTYTHGLYTAIGNAHARMYLNRGLGTIIAPVRLFCRPEIAEITLNTS